MLQLCPAPCVEAVWGPRHVLVVVWSLCQLGLSGVIEGVSCVCFQVGEG